MHSHAACIQHLGAEVWVSAFSYF